MFKHYLSLYNCVAHSWTDFADFGKDEYVNITLHFESSLPLKLRIQYRYVSC